MNSLAGLLACAVATLAFYVAVVRRPGQKRRAIVQVCFIALHALTLLLALRVGARTYPGIFVPSSTVLNRIFNGGALFSIGCGLVVLGATSHAASLLPLTGRLSRGLQGLSLSFALLAAAISAYGFFWAAVLHRLP